MLRISMKKTAAAAAVTFAFVAGSLVQTSPIAPITSAHAQQAQLPRRFAHGAVAELGDVVRQKTLRVRLGIFHGQLEGF